MKTKLIAFKLCLILLQNGKAQDSVINSAIVISPALFTPQSVALQTGFSYPLGQKVSLLAEVAFPLLGSGSLSQEDADLWRTSLEVRKYRRQHNRKILYYSLQASYLFRKIEEGTGYFIRSDRSHYNYDAATLRSPVLSAALKLGNEFVYMNGKTLTECFQ